MRKLICFAVAAWLSLPDQSYAAKSQKTAPPVKPSETILFWEKEPKSILGIGLGVPLSSSMAECPKRNASPGPICWEKVGGMQSTYILNTPDIGVKLLSVVAKIIDGSVEKVDISFFTAQYREMASLLKIKYGEPTKAETIAMQNKMGATYDSIFMTWAGKNYTMYLDSMAGRIDRGVVSIYSEKYINSARFNPSAHTGNL